MNRLIVPGACAALLLLPVRGLPAQERVALVGGTIHTVTRGIVSPGTVLLAGGRIVDVRPGAQAPAGYQVIDVAGRSVLPGLVDAHVHEGLRRVPLTPENFETAENTDPFTPQMLVLDGLDPTLPGLRALRTYGTTTALVLPGSSDLIGGQGAVIKLRDGPLDSLVLLPRAVLKLALGMNPKSAFGTKGRSPKTRMAVATMLREKFREAARYRARRAGRDSGAVDPELEPIARALAGELRLHVHAARADDIRTTLALMREFGLTGVIAHGYEAYLVAGEVAAQRVPIVLGPILSGWEQGAPPTAPVNVAGMLVTAGVDLSIVTDGFVPDLLLQARYAVRLGLREEDALRAITINPARVIRLDQRLGSIEAGKDADLVVLSGPPFAAGSVVEEVYIDGRRIHARDR